MSICVTLCEVLKGHFEENFICAQTSNIYPYKLVTVDHVMRSRDSNLTKLKHLYKPLEHCLSKITIKTFTFYKLDYSHTLSLKIDSLHLQLPQTLMRKELERTL